MATKPEEKVPVGRTSVDSDHLQSLLDGKKLTGEQEKRYRRLLFLAQKRAEYDAGKA